MLFQQLDNKMCSQQARSKLVNKLWQCCSNNLKTRFVFAILQVSSIHMLTRERLSPDLYPEDYHLVPSRIRGYQPVSGKPPSGATSERLARGGEVNCPRLPAVGRNIFVGRNLVWKMLGKVPRKQLKLCCPENFFPKNLSTGGGGEKRHCQEIFSLNNWE